MPDRRIRLIALDLDGTLLDSQKRLSEANRAALARAAEAGALIVPTTGRFFDMMPQVVRDLPFVRYAITSNGAQVYDRATGEAVVRDEMPLDEAIAVMEILDGYDVIYDCYRNGWGWMTESLQAKAAEYAPDEHYLKMVREYRTPVPELKAHLRATASEGDVQKIMLFVRGVPGADAALSAIVRDVGARFPDVRITCSTHNNLELNANTAHKGNALRRLAGHLGFTAAECMAFGDGRNDLTMIEAAGVGVAMGNAVEEVRRVADIVAPTNDEDGVASVIARFFPA